MEKPIMEPVVKHGAWGVIAEIGGVVQEAYCLGQADLVAAGYKSTGEQYVQVAESRKPLLDIVEEKEKRIKELEDGLQMFMDIDGNKLSRSAYLMIRSAALNGHKLLGFRKEAK